jgi:hypothetical protein
MYKMSILKIGIFDQFWNNDSNLITCNIVIILLYQTLYDNILIFSKKYIIKFKMINCFVYFLI